MSVASERGVPLVLFEAGGLRAVELHDGDEPRLQRFFDANPEYFQAVGGAPPRPDEAHEEMHGPLPAGWPYTRTWPLGLVEAGVDQGGELAGIAHVVSDLLAPSVWHVGLFVVATRLHGRGVARPVYDALERWMQRRGARHVRLGVVEGNVRGERFWERASFVEVRTREDIEVGLRRVTVRVMAKPLDGARLDDYLALVPRDRPDATAPPVPPSR